MPNYNKGCIYMIKHNQDFNNENVYIGSCCNFTRRKCGHKSDCNNPNSRRYNFKLYQTIKDNGGWDEWIMLKLHDFPCNEKYELNLEERRVIDLYKSKLNIKVPTRTNKEYRDENKEKLKDINKKYYDGNKDKIKKYYDENKDKIKEINKKYRDENKEKINEKITCECGSIVRKHDIARHRKSLKHISFLDNTKIN